MRIGELARAANVATSRIRFYEADGLLPSPHRAANGYRDYPPEALQTILFIEQAQRLGFSLKEIRAALPGEYGRLADCSTILGSLRQKVSEVERHVAETLAVKAGLLQMIELFERRRSEGTHITLDLARDASRPSALSSATLSGPRAGPRTRAETRAADRADEG